MKRILLFLLLVSFGVLQAQIVNIPDANFKQFLLEFGIDSNNDGEIQFSEASQVYFLSISNDDITSLEGIESFVNMHKLTLGTSGLSWIFPALPALEELQFSTTSSSLSNPDIFDISALTGVKKIKFDNDYGTRVNGIGNLHNIEEFECLAYYTEITNMDFSGMNALKSFILDGNIDTNSLYLGDKPMLETLIINDAMEVVLGLMPKLLNFKFLYGITPALDLSGSPLLNNFWYDGQASYINLKNGNSYYDSFELGVGPLTYICIDEDEEIYFTPQNSQGVNFNSYCIFFPGGDYNVITGSMIFDNDGDGCDSNDSVINNIKLNVSNGTESHSTTSSLGLYNIFTQAGTYTITPDFENDHFTITPPFAEINFTEVDSLVTTQNFCLTPNGNHPDLDIVVVPFGARPGFDADYKIIYRNKGNQTLSGEIVFTYQEDEMDFISANPPQDTSALGTLIWNYLGLAPFEQRQIFVTLNVNGPMETPAVNIDDNLQFTATINPVTGDDTPLDNVFGLKETVIGSFDPNDITCLEGRSVNPDKIGEYLHYNINFENTGTAPATFIVVKDVIDTTQFEMATLQMIHASHPVQATVTGNKVEFRFDEINLAPEGKGNVVFKIKTLNSLQVNDDVTQQADIFFDYNWPIVTNEATTVFEVLSRGEFEKDNTVKIYPNPSNGILNITAASEIKSFELYDVQGRLLQAGGNASLDISGRAAGMYFVNVLTEAGMKVEKVVKK